MDRSDHDQSGGTHNTNKQISFKTSMLRSDLCDYSDAYIVVKGKITVTNLNNTVTNHIHYDKKLAFKNNEPFTSCISKINNAVIDNAENLYVVILLYNLLLYSKNYRKTINKLFNQKFKVF